MRAIALAAILLLLAGCSSPKAPAEQPQAPADEFPVPPPLTLVDDTFAWHAGPGYPMASQAAANPCIFDGEPYFNDRRIPVNVGERDYWEGDLVVTFDWTDEDFLGDHLVLAYKAPGMASWAESQIVPRGVPTTIPIVPDWNVEQYGWALAACINNASTDNPTSPDFQTTPFLGSFHVVAVFTALR